jgi:hypothetical protein
MHTPLHQQLLLLWCSRSVELICQLLKQRPNFQEDIKAILTCLLLLAITTKVEHEYIEKSPKRKHTGPETTNLAQDLYSSGLWLFNSVEVQLVNLVPDMVTLVHCLNLELWHKLF